MAPAIAERAPLIKFTVDVAPENVRTGDTEVLEVSPPPDLYEDWEAAARPAASELALWIRDTFYPGARFVSIYGGERISTQPPREPRLSLPRALPSLRRDPTRSAIRAIKDVPVRLPAELRGGTTGRFYGHIKLDLDGVRPTRQAVARWARDVGLHRKFEWRASSSGKGTHVRFRVREGLEPREAYALRIALGDDPIRVAVDASRYPYHGKSAIGGVLFDRKGDGSAGAWHKLRRGIR